MYSAHSDVQEVLTSIRQAREQPEVFEAIWDNIEKLTTVSKPRTTGHHTLRPNVPAETDKVYFRRSLFIPYMDHLITDMEDRFEASPTLAEGSMEERIP